MSTPLTSKQSGRIKNGVIVNELDRPQVDSNETRFN